MGMKYDDASWHYEGNFPADQPTEHGGTHIALFLEWCFSRGWAGELHTEEEPEAVTHVAAGRLPATEFLFKYCDGKFTDDDLNDEGNSFASKYYGADGLYLDDYEEHFGAQMYVAPEAEHDFARFSTMLVPDLPAECWRSRSRHEQISRDAEPFAPADGFAAR